MSRLEPTRGPWSRILPMVGAAVGVLLAPRTVRAHRDDYIDETFVYQTLRRRELTFEVWGDARLGRDGVLRGWYTGAIELGLTDRWMADAAAQWLHTGGTVAFGRVRVETRYRFAEEGAWPVDVATSLEYEAERDDPSATFAQVLTPRLVVSKDIVPRLNTTLNLDLRIALGPAPWVSFVYAFGVRYPAEALVRVGAELRHDVGRGTVVLFPQVWLWPAEGLMIKLGVGIGVAGPTDPFIGRIALELETD